MFASTEETKKVETFVKIVTTTENHGEVISETKIENFTKILKPMETQIVSGIKVMVRQDLLHLEWINDWTNIVVAGGHILNAILGDEEASKKGDIDIFFVSEKVGNLDMRREIRKIFDSLCSFYSEVPTIELKGSSVKFFLPNALGVDKPLKVQVIFLKFFLSVEKLLESFDFNNCQFAYQKGCPIFATINSIIYLGDKRVYYYNPDNNMRRKIRMLKYKDRSYNTIVPMSQCPHGCSASNMMDYNIPVSNPETGVKFPSFGEHVSIEKALSFVPKMKK